MGRASPAPRYFFQTLMDQQDEFYRRVQQQEKEKKQRERSKKWDERGKRFWSTFLFTENGKPKSGLIIYTFSLSFVMLAAYLLSYNFIIERPTGLTASWPVFWGNLLESLAASAVLLLLTWLLHRLLRDKRLMLGTWLWMALYAVAAVITMLILLRGTGAVPEFLKFLAWFVLIPLALGLLLSALLYRRDYVPPAPAVEEAPWKKYIRRQ